MTMYICMLKKIILSMLYVYNNTYNRTLIRDSVIHAHMHMQKGIVIPRGDHFGNVCQTQFKLSVTGCASIEVCDDFSIIFFSFHFSFLFYSIYSVVSFLLLSCFV